MGDVQMVTGHVQWLALDGGYHATMTPLNRQRLPRSAAAGELFHGTENEIRWAEIAKFLRPIEIGRGIPKPGIPQHGQQIPAEFMGFATDFPRHLAGKGGKVHQFR